MGSTGTVTVVVGGQYGSEGKGKVVHSLARDHDAAAVIRVGGPNSGHTVLSRNGERVVLRQLPVGALLDQPLCLLGPGSYIDIGVLMSEIDRLAVDPARVVIDRNAVIVTEVDREAERQAGIGDRIGSTCSGTGAAVIKRIKRETRSVLAHEVAELQRFVDDVPRRARMLVSAGERVIVEGTQGFGLSILHSRDYPHVTTRDTSAAGALAEAGLSPLDVSDVVLVLRAFPIRVAGRSGDFHAEELTWEQLTAEGGHTEPLHERTSVTGKTRRVARFDSELVQRAVSVNQPTVVVLNHVDYVDASSDTSGLSMRAGVFVDWVEDAIEREIDFVGLGPDTLISRQTARARVVAA